MKHEIKVGDIVYNAYLKKGEQGLFEVVEIRKNAYGRHLGYTVRLLSGYGGWRVKMDENLKATRVEVQVGEIIYVKVAGIHKYNLTVEDIDAEIKELNRQMDDLIARKEELFRKKQELIDYIIAD